MLSSISCFPLLSSAEALRLNLDQVRAVCRFACRETSTRKPADEIHCCAGVQAELDRRKGALLSHCEWQQELILQVRPGKRHRC